MFAVYGRCRCSPRTHTKRMQIWARLVFQLRASNKLINSVLPDGEGGPCFCWHWCHAANHTQPLTTSASANSNSPATAELARRSCGGAASSAAGSAARRQNAATRIRGRREWRRLPGALSGGGGEPVRPGWQPSARGSGGHDSASDWRTFNPTSRLA